MRRLVVIVGLTLTLGLQAMEADAGWNSAKAKWHSFWDGVHLDWHRNNAWPEPFTDVDVKAARAPFTVMIDNGWRLQNTIPDPLFDQETQQLNAAGELKVHWILTQMPIRRRNVFVLRGKTDEKTKIRLESVQKVAVGSVGEGGASMVSVTDVAPRGGSGAHFERIQQGYESAAPPPQLPVMSEDEG